MLEGRERGVMKGKGKMGEEKTEERENTGIKIQRKMGKIYQRKEEEGRRRGGGCGKGR